MLVGLYELPEKPVNATDFVKEYMGTPASEDVEKLKSLVAEQQRLIKEKDEEIAKLKEELQAAKSQ